jgi:hypothetical protein
MISWIRLHDYDSNHENVELASIAAASCHRVDRHFKTALDRAGGEPIVLNPPDEISATALKDLPTEPHLGRVG